ncbi:DUF5691 domain-containing protein, partial [Pseudomonas savastanoi]
MPRLSTKGLSPQPPTRHRWLIGAAAAAMLALSLAFWWWRLPVQTAPARLSHTYAQALEQAHDGKPGAARVLYQQLARTDLSDEQRINLLAELSDYPSPQALKLLDAALGDRSAQVREAAIDVSVRLVSNSQRSLLLGPLLDDDEQSVRFRATSALLGLSPDELGLYFAVLQQSAEAFQESLKSQLQNAQNQLQLARLYLQTGDLEPAVAALQRATALDPGNIEAALAHIELLDRKGQAE